MKYLGFVLFAIGLSLCGLSLYTNQRIQSAAVTQMENSDSGRPRGGPIARRAERASEQKNYQTMATNRFMSAQTASYELSLGVVFISLGLVIALFFIVQRKH